MVIGCQPATELPPPNRAARVSKRLSGSPFATAILEKPPFHRSSSWGKLSARLAIGILLSPPDSAVSISSIFPFVESPKLTNRVHQPAANSEHVALRPNQTLLTACHHNLHEPPPRLARLRRPTRSCGCKVPGSTNQRYQNGWHPEHLEINRS